MSKKLIIGTRGSRLALWQAYNLQDKLNAISIESELKIIKTQGDRIQDLSFDKLEGKGFFTKEIEDALINDEIDIAVHSLKDLPTDGVEGLVIAGLSERQDNADLLIISKEANGAGPLKLKENAVVGTSSIRRKVQIQNLLDSVEVKDLRGNVPTRIQKLADGHYDAIILAAAGINRLDINLEAYNVVRLNPKEFVPSPGQGVIGYQTRESDLVTRKIVAKIHNKDVAEVTNVERKVLNLLDGGCQLPLGVHCEKDSQGYFHAYAAYAKEANSPLKRINISQSTRDQLAENIVKDLLN